LGAALGARALWDLTPPSTASPRAPVTSALPPRSLSEADPAVEGAAEPLPAAEAPSRAPGADVGGPTSRAGETPERAGSSLPLPRPTPETGHSWRAWTETRTMKPTIAATITPVPDTAPTT
jgi:hypothetical protein